MLPHGLLKIACAYRSVFYRKCLINRKLRLRSNFCNYNNTTPFRLGLSFCFSIILAYYFYFIIIVCYRSIATVSALKVPDKPRFNIGKRYSGRNESVTNNIAEKQTFSKTREKKFEPISSEELLEKYIAGLSTDIHLKNRVYKNDLQRVITKVKISNFSTKKQQLLLLHCCTDLMPDEAPITRMALAEEIWTTIE